MLGSGKGKHGWKQSFPLLVILKSSWPWQGLSGTPQKQHLWLSPLQQRRGTASPALLNLSFSFKNSWFLFSRKPHLTSSVRGLCSWISLVFHLQGSELTPLGPLVEKAMFWGVWHIAKSTQSSTQLNTAISPQAQGGLNTQQPQKIPYRVFPLSICFGHKRGLLNTFCLSNYRPAATAACSQLFHYLLFIYTNALLKMTLGEVQCSDFNINRNWKKKKKRSGNLGVIHSTWPQEHPGTSKCLHKTWRKTLGAELWKTQWQTTTASTGSTGLAKHLSEDMLS